MSTCEIPESVLSRYEKFRKGRTGNRALVLSCDVDELVVVIEEDIKKNADLGDLDLPGTEPRFIIYAAEFSRTDGRKSFPLLLIFVSPPCNTTLNVIYSSTQKALMNRFGFNKVFTLDDPDDLDQEWLQEQLEEAYN